MSEPGHVDEMLFLLHQKLLTIRQQGKEGDLHYFDLSVGSQKILDLFYEKIGAEKVLLRYMLFDIPPRTYPGVVRVLLNCQSRVFPAKMLNMAPCQPTSRLVTCLAALRKTNGIIDRHKFLDEASKFVFIDISDKSQAVRECEQPVSKKRKK